MVDFSALAGAHGAVWDGLTRFARERPDGWTLIGAQMVIALAQEHGRSYSRTTTDADLVADVRVLTQGVKELANHLVANGFELEGISAEGIGHRFHHEGVAFDLLGPDAVRDKAKLVTVPPARTVCVPGGTQALARTRRLEVQGPNERGFVPVPDLLGAILVKARAVDVDDVPEAQLADLAFLLSLVPDPRELAQQVRRTERSWLRCRDELHDDKHPAWRRLEREAAENGMLTLRILTE